MFNNPGEKLKTLAKIVFYVLLFLPLVTGIVMVIMGLIDGFGGEGFGISAVLIGILLLALGFANAWLGSIFLYAFGELVENSAATRKAVEQILKLEKEL